MVFGVVTFGAMGVHLITQFVGVCELQAEDVFFVEAVTLECVDHQSCLKAVLEVGKTQDDSLIWRDLPRDQSNRLKSFEWPKDVYTREKQFTYLRSVY